MPQLTDRQKGVRDKVVAWSAGFALLGHAVAPKSVLVPLVAALGVLAGAGRRWRRI